MRTLGTAGPHSLLDLLKIYIVTSRRLASTSPFLLLLGLHSLTIIKWLLLTTHSFLHISELLTHLLRSPYYWQQKIKYKPVQ